MTTWPKCLLQTMLKMRRPCPQSPLRWTCQSTRNLAEALGLQRHQVSYPTVALLLHDLGYSLQANRKTREGSSHADRDAQFEHINRQVCAFQEQGQPVVSVDTKKKELIGDFKNAGQEWQPEGAPEEVRMYDFADKRLGKVRTDNASLLFDRQRIVSCSAPMSRQRIVS